MIINWEINHIDLLQASKSSNIDMGEGRTGFKISLFGVICAFKTNWKWKSLNKEVVFETWSTEVTIESLKLILKGYCRVSEGERSDKMPWHPEKSPL